MELKFTASSIRAIETELKKPLLDLIAVISVGNMLAFIKYGMFLKNDSEAEKVMNEYLSDKNNDITTLHVEILEGLKAGHFLPRSVDVAEIKAQLTSL